MYKLTMYCENQPCVIARIANLLRKRNISIISMHADTRSMVKRVKGVMTSLVVVEAGFESEHKEENVRKQIERLINVIQVESKKINKD